jgi:hypothetical protein
MSSTVCEKLLRKRIRGQGLNWAGRATEKKKSYVKSSQADLCTPRSKLLFACFRRYYSASFKVKVTLRLTVSQSLCRAPGQSVSQSLSRAPSGARDQVLITV